MINLSQETYGKAVEVAHGFWIIATHHRPGLSRKMFEINNRCLIFKVTDAGTNSSVLAVFNAVDPAQSFSEVHRLEKETGLTVRYIISPGGGHHMHIAPWHDEFTQAKVFLGPIRTPHTGNGKKLMHLPRVSLMKETDPLPMFKGQIDAILFRGLIGAADRQAPGEGGKDTTMSMIGTFIHFMTKVNQPTEELWIYHPMTQTVIGGENLAWYYRKDDLKNQPFMLRMMIKPDQLTIMTTGRKVGDAKVVADCWNKILLWPSTTIMTYHELPGIAFHGDGKVALTEAVKAAKQL